MSEVIDQLHRDHANMARLLDFIDAEIAKVGGDEAPDFELMHEVMHYMTCFPDRAHHPKEDRIFERLRAHDDVPDIEIDAMLTEHRELTALGNTFLEALRALESDAIMRTDHFVQMARRYTHVQRKHLDREEGRLFKLAAKLLSDEDWGAIDAEFSTAPDPLFGTGLRMEYQRIVTALADVG